MVKKQIPILEVGDVLISTDILTEYFCCDLSSCGGACCIEGDAGAPVTLDEVSQIEASLEAIWSDMSVSAQSVVNHQGVAYTDAEGDLVTSIVHGKDCIFTYHAPLEGETGSCCFCTLERACREGRIRFMKPISCALYPIREKHFSGGLIGLNLHRWAVCEPAFRHGKEIGLPVYRFLREPLIRRFGEAWYHELEDVAEALKP